ncbi:MAG: hypothetical protein NZT61_07620 [Deltaproteobacteria bacterium]|nr:hypothetical protein [Deltaproteobacteria bacterium]
MKSPLLSNKKTLEVISQLFTSRQSFKGMMASVEALSKYKMSGMLIDDLVKTAEYQNWLKALKLFEDDITTLLRNRNSLIRALDDIPAFKCLSAFDKQRLKKELFDDGEALLYALKSAQEKLEQSITKHAPAILHKRMHKEARETFNRLKKRVRRKSKRRKKETTAKRDRKNENKKSTKANSSDTGDSFKTYDNDLINLATKNPSLRPERSPKPTNKPDNILKSSTKNTNHASFLVRHNNRKLTDEILGEKTVQETPFGLMDKIKV